MIEGFGAGYGPGSVLCTTVVDPGGPKTYGSYGPGSATLLKTYLNSINWVQVLEVAELEGHQHIQISKMSVFLNDVLSFLSEKMIYYRQNSFKVSLLYEKSYAWPKLLFRKISSYTEYRQKVSPQCELSDVGLSHLS
jgi:hypothetical protein